MSFLKLKKFPLIGISALILSCNAFSESEETLAIRRIATCYHEKDFELSGKLIDHFFETYPSSCHLENLYLLQADNYLQKKEWKKALTAYQLIQSPLLRDESFIQRLHCHYSLRNFQALKKEIEPRFNDLSNLSTSDQNIVTFYFAESLFKDDLKSLNSKDLTRILKLYNTLLNTSFEAYAKVSMAHIYALQNKHNEASDLFSQSAKAFPDQKERLLFAAASHQSHFDPNLATETFNHIKELNAHTHQEAFYNWMVLLYHSDNFEKIIESRDELLSQIPDSKISSTHLILGKTFFKQKQYIAALNHFDKCLDGHNPKMLLQEVSLLGLLASYQLNDLYKLNSYLSILEKKFRSSKEYSEGLFWKAKYFQNNKEFSKALHTYHKVIKTKSEKLLPSSSYQIALIYYQQDQFQKAQSSFTKLLKNFPDSAYSKPSISYLLQSCFKLLHQKESPKVKQQLIDAHLAALNMKGYFEKDQVPQVHLSIAKLYLDLGRQKEFEETLTTFLSLFPKNDKTYQAHLLLAYSSKKKQDGLDNYLQHLEDAAFAAPPLEVLSPIYADLFYGYLQSAKRIKSMEIVFEKVSDCVIELINFGYDFPKSLYLWFSQSFFQELEKKIKDSREFENADLLEKASKILTYYIQKFPEIESAHDQNIRFNYARVLGWQRLFKQQLKSLQSLNKQLNPDSSLYFKSLFEEALCHQILDQKDTAIDIYEKIISKQSLFIQDVSLKAKLNLARLLTVEYLSNKNSTLLNKINELYEDLHVARSFKNEPLHLEAALDSSLLNHLDFLQKKDYSSYLKALIKIKDDFSNKDTLLTQEYHEIRLKSPEENSFYESYMMFLDARILNLQAKLQTNENDSMKKEKMALAQKILSRLQKENTTPYLSKIIQIETQSYKKDVFTDDFFCDFTKGLNNEL
ncbi:MAG: Cell division coordinator CpoB [Chlamydiae bacterium]|nr:Cell division coordinator CpoB [Chlamydiota bacterium]